MKLCLIFTTLGVLLGCNVTETGNPPVAPEVEPMTITPSAGFGTNLVILRGIVEPAGAEVTVANLDEVGSRSVGVVDASGAFEVTVSAEIGDALRFEAKANVRGQPVDRLVAAAETGLRFDTPFSAYADCLSVPTLVELEQDNQVTIRNDCSEAIQFLEPRWWSGSDSFQITPSTVTPLNPRATATLTIEPNASSTGVLIIETDSAVADRRAISIYGAP